MDNLLNQVYKIWGFKKVELIKAIRSGISKKIYLIETNEGKFILMGFGPTYSEESFLRYISVLEYLENKPVKLAPKILMDKEGNSYAKIDNKFICIMEYIDGRTLGEELEDEYRLGETIALLHSFDDFQIESDIRINDTIEEAYKKFYECPYKSKLYKIIDVLPNFYDYRQGFIHTDIAPHNAIINKNNKVILIDFDGAGKGSIYIDAGFPLITQFVRFHGPGDLRFNYENAKAFYSGYSSITKLETKDKQLIYAGAVFWQLAHMPSYQPGTENNMLDILKFAIANRDELISVL
ncbi:hypothetical protein CPJCM30710_03570 [Clostridium polyendosporum]|uniref:Protein kinase domain-containing protein n=1 Tax=Clostridium polyendosporum TaxID=69208 RepID=A0A919VFN8_9CLOT|nr:aminoglycoside phosphotransferase family protein [Clostridium polyendosporum]GIM27691.1 hypothetical protein CPJCM30710_03570 [Clostridium polyendosporum]